MHPGRLTLEYLQGRRARYLSPIRVYLIVSLVYFLVAAAAPAGTTRSGQSAAPGGLRIDVSGAKGQAGMLTAEDRAELLKDVDQQLWFLRPMLRAMAEDPAGFRARIFTIMPRVFFALLPVFAGIVALFYRGRRFPTALVFAVHVHAFAFLVFALSEAAKFSSSGLVEGAVGVIVTTVFAWYVLSAMRAVFGGRWPITIAKAAGIGAVYLLASVPAFIIMLIWASLV
jgi:hypothetical protein